MSVDRLSRPLPMLLSTPYGYLRIHVTMPTDFVLLGSSFLSLLEIYKDSVQMYDSHVTHNGLIRDPTRYNLKNYMSPMYYGGGQITCLVVTFLQAALSFVYLTHTLEWNPLNKYFLEEK